MSGFPLFPKSASTLAPQVDTLMLFALGIATVFTLLIAFLLVVFAVRYRRRSVDEIGAPDPHATWLEIVWSVIPLVILLVMFGWGAKVFFFAMRPPADAIEYYVTGKQWMWKFQHPEGPREINTLHVPVGQPVKLTMTSEDVIHSFFVPDFRVKMDVLPGRYTTTWFEATKTGTYTLFCAEYCGVEHSRMGGKIVVMEPSQYDEWLTAQGGSAVGGEMVSGADLFTAKNCQTCHNPNNDNLGPYLEGLFGTEETLEGGATVLVDENYLRESILDPTAKMVAGYQALMPTYQGQLNEEELAGLIQYIKTLGNEPEEEDLAATDSAPADGDEPAP